MGVHPLSAMKRLGVGVVCLLAVVSWTSATNTYVVMFPKSIRPGLNMKIHVNILNAKTPVTVTASVLNNSNGTVTTSIADFSQGTPGTMALQIPSTLGWGQYKVMVAGTGGLTFINVTNVDFQSKSSSIFIQTDKAIYKPGQTVNFRAFGIYPDLKVVLSPLDVEIYDPKGNKIGQWLAVQDPSGVYTGKIEVSDQPLLGDWKVKVTQNSKSEEKVFTIDEYVLPKFEVTVTLPSFGVSDSTPFTGKITARYTFGKPVKGRVSLIVKKKWQPWRLRQAPGIAPPSVQKEFDIDGEATFSILMSDIKNNIEQHLNHDWLVVEANVTETLTGITLNGTSEIQFFDAAEKLDFVQSLPKDFKPGLLYTAYLKVSQQDGRPIVKPTGQVSVKVTLYMEKPRPSTKIPPLLPEEPRPPGPPERMPVNEPLIVPEMVGRPAPRLVPVDEPLIVPERVGRRPAPNMIMPPMPPPWEPRETTKVLPTKSLVITEDGIIPFDIDIPVTTTRVSVEAKYMKHTAYLNLRRSRSPSESYAQVRLLTEKPAAGSDALFEIRTTDRPSKILYQILAKGSLVHSGEVTAATNRPVTSLVIPMTTTMAPKARMVVHYVRDDGEIVADAVSFNVDGAFANKVDIGFDKVRASPGQTVNVKVTADAGSVVNLLAVDQSVLLLKSGNDITSGQVKTEIESYDTTTGSGGGGGDGPIFFRWPVPSGGGDADDIFRNAGMQVLTDAVLYSHRERWFGTTTTPITSTSTHIPATINLIQATSRAPSTTAPERTSQRVRKVFPETWIWTHSNVSADGVATISATVPDTITSWVASAFAINPMSGLGVDPNTASLEAFLNFFVSLTLPYSVIRGEQIVLQANVFNYMNVDAYVLVTLHKSDDYDNVIVYSSGSVVQAPAKISRFIYVKRQSALAAYFPIVPKKIGNIHLSVYAQSLWAGDAVERTLLVEPEGVPREYNTPILVEPKQGVPFSTVVNITFPNNTVAGSQRVRATAIGDMMGPSISGLDKLLKMPYGCGEQNMLNFAPNIFVAKYLEATNNLTPDLEDKVKGFTVKGYQRELTYQHKDGSFSAFGDSDDSGSTWLTAFVVKSFVQARSLIFIDEDNVVKAVQWLVRQQTPNGTFNEPGRVIHKSMQGGSASGKLSLAAYVLISLLEASAMTSIPTSVQPAIIKTKEYLEREVSGTTDMYDLAILSYALTLAKSPPAAAALTQLEALATVKDGMKYWAKPEDTSSSGSANGLVWRPPHGQSKAVNIEMTSYALLTYAANRDLDSGLLVLKWITTQRNPSGGFSSTQDTVMALQALAEMASLIYSPNFDMTVTLEDAAVPGNAFTHQFTIGVQNALVLQSVDVPTEIEQLRVTATGRGLSLVEVAVFYNVEAEIQEPWFDLNITLSKETIDSFTLTACTRWLKKGSSGMAVMEMGVPSGFASDRMSITQMKILKRIEDGAKKQILYFDEIGVDAVCISLDMNRKDMVAGVQPTAVRVFDYYEPQNEKTVLYQSNVLRDSTVCDVCGVECGCPKKP